jgi:hypothetical protein
MTSEQQKENRLILIKPKSLSPKDKEKLTKKGFTVIETDYPGSGFTMDKQSTQFDAVAHRYIFTLCNTCGERIYRREEHQEVLLKNAKYFYCVNGHSQYYSNNNKK